MVFPMLWSWARTLLCPGTSTVASSNEMGKKEPSTEPRDSRCAAWKAGEDLQILFCLLDFSAFPQSFQFFRDFSFASSVNIALERREVKCELARSLIDAAREQITRDDVLPSCCIRVRHDFHHPHAFGIVGEEPSFGRFGVRKELAQGTQTVVRSGWGQARSWKARSRKAMFVPHSTPVPKGSAGPGEPDPALGTRGPHATT